MGALEVILLLLGGIVFVLSFLLPAGRSSSEAGTKKLVESEVKMRVDGEMDDIKDRIEEMVDETVQSAMEKTERSLERVSNEKIMAVNEYSDTVLEDINKNHKEVLFLYDMLSDKHQNLQSTVTLAEKTLKEVQQSTEEARSQQETMEAQMAAKTQMIEEVKKGAEANTEKAVSEPRMEIPAIEMKDEPEAESAILMLQQHAAAKRVAKSKKITATQISKPDISFINASSGENNNERILEMHNQGKSNVAIAKELGLGVGEVKLVIDLFEVV